MANNEIKIRLKIDDNGDLSVVAGNAKAASKGLDGVSKSARTADRGLKGASQQSANGTKNFSKMAQGISGGLVPAYATLAAQVFAVSAVFNFLKDAGDFKVLQQGQEAYAKQTGIAIKSLTNDIIAATEAQISYKDAAQGAAIGLAAGLSTNQLEKLGKAARDTSAVLGRDVTDSFNRLIKGVTKAEPELLDELGIILRLDTATQKYADALGKNAKELTQFEKSQAVANDVLEQAEEKYAKVLEGQENVGNSVAKLGIAFQNDLVKPVKEALADILIPLINFLTENITALSIAFGLFAAPIVKQIIPGLNDMGQAASEAAEEAKQALEKEKTALKDKIKNLKEVKRTQNDVAKNASKNAQKALADLKARKGSGLETVQMGGIPTERQLSGMIRAAKKGQGEYEKLSAKTRMKVVADFEAMRAGGQRFTTSVTGYIKIMSAQVTTQFAKIRVAWATTLAAMKAATVIFARAANAILAGLGWIGIFVLVASLAKEAYDWLVKFFETAEEKEARLIKEKEERRLEAITEKLKNINSELDNMKKKQISAGAAGAAFVGNFLSNIDLPTLKEALLGDNEELRTEAESVLKSYRRVLLKSSDAVGSLANNTSYLIKKILEKKNASKADVEQMLQEISALQELGKAGEKFTKALSEQNEIERSFIGSLTETSKYDNLINAANATIAASREVARLTEEERKNVDRTVALRDLLVSFRDQEFDTAKRNIMLETKYLGLMAKASPLQRESLQEQQKIEQINSSIAQKTREISDLQALIAQRGTEATPSEQQKLDLLSLQTLQLGLQKNILLEQATLLGQIEQNAKGAFEGSVTSSLNDLITGKNNSFKQAVGNIALATLESVASTLSENISESISDFLFDNPAQMQAELIRKAHVDGITQGFAAAGIPVATPTGSAGTNTAGASTGGLTQNTSIFSKLFGASSQSSTFGTNAEGMEEVTTVAKKGGIFGNFLGSLKDIFDSNVEGGFIQKLGIAFEAGAFAFKDLFSAGLNLISQLFSGGIGGGGGGGFLASVASLFFAKGGYATGGFRAFATGGVVNKPTIGMVGEGRHNEAIVPLPDGKSIPVMMKGAGQMNNVTVNISMGNGGTQQDSQANSSQGENLGKLIAGAVQRELQNQKRSGGILNPYGVA